MDFIQGVLLVIFGSFSVFIFVSTLLFKIYFESEPVTQKELTKLHFSSTQFNDDVISLCPSIQIGYKPVSWGKNGHIQTLYHLIFRRSPIITYKRVLLNASNEKIAIDIFPANANPDVPTVVLIPGIAGSSKQHYIRNFVDTCAQKGWRSVVLNHRGCNSDLSHPEIFCIGSTKDLRLAFEYIHNNWPRSPIVAVGFSMGANIIVNYAGEYHGKKISESPKHIPLHAVISISQGYDLQTTGDFVPSKRPIYDYGLNLKMTALLKKNQGIFDKLDSVDVSAILKTKSMVEFHDLYTCKVLNLPSQQQYYKSQCCSRYLRSIDIPLMMLNALDDPIVPEFQVKLVYDVCKSNNKLIMVTTKYGGHLGFHEGGFLNLIPKQKTWMDRMAVEYLDAVLIKTSAMNNGTSSVH